MKRISHIQFNLSTCYLCFPQILIASIMCSYNKDDWTELAKMAEVGLAKMYQSFAHIHV